MGYCTSASVLIGVVVAAQDTRAAIVEASDGKALECPTDTESYEEWVREFAATHGLALRARDLSRREESDGRPAQPDAVWASQVLICAQHPERSWSEKTITTTEFWGHSACASVSSWVPLNSVRLADADRAQIDALLRLLRLDPSNYPTQLVLVHTGG